MSMVAPEFQQSLPALPQSSLVYRHFSVCVPDPVIVYDRPSQSRSPLIRAWRTPSMKNSRA
jgi:hypothetical protein